MPSEHIRGLVDATVTRLIKETGITDLQARDLIAMMGLDWSSLIREAHLIPKIAPA